MPPKKRLKTVVDSDVKAKNLRQTCKTEPVVVSNRLSFLPVDVLLYICKFLSPVDLLSLSKLEEPLFTDLTNVQKEVNFSICRRANFELVSSYFSRERVKNIQKLNFNYYIFGKPCDLVRIICRCKNLTVLSVVECGIEYKHIHKILNRCTVLNELVWNVQEVDPEEDICHFPNVTKLFLFCDITRNTMHTIHFITMSFPKFETIIICFCCNYLMVPPFIGSWSKSFTNDDRLTQPSKNDSQGRKFLHLIFGLHPELKGLWNFTNRRETFSSYLNVCYNYPPFLKVKTSERDISYLSSCDSDVYSSVVVVLTDATADVYERLFMCVSKVARSKLKHLTFEYENCEIPFQSPPDGPSHQLYEKVSDMFELVFINCQNITVLNIGTIHFTTHSPFKAMCHLKNLKALNMSTCAFCKTSSNSVGSKNQLDQDQCSDFEKMILNCWKVEDFHLICCKKDLDVICEGDILPIHKWKTLKSFSVYSVIFRTCSFLRKVADFCPEFSSFSLISTYPYNGCIFYNDVIYLLLTAKKLSFLRINETRFNPLFERFLNAVHSAKNLEGLCIMSQCNTHFTAAPFIKQIKTLKYLHLFHFDAPSVSENLYAEVRKSMDKNGIKNIIVEKRCLDAYHVLPETDDNNYLHIKPYFACRHLHIKQSLFDFFSL